MISRAALFSVLASATIAAQPVSEHNELQAAIKAGYHLLLEAGCVYPTHSRTKRYSLELDGPGYRIVGNDISLTCSKWGSVTTATLAWDAPATRTDGTALLPADIATYTIVHNGENLRVLGGHVTIFTITDLTVGSHSFAIKATDAAGRESGLSETVTLEVN